MPLQFPAKSSLHLVVLLLFLILYYHLEMRKSGEVLFISFDWTLTLTRLRELSDMSKESPYRAYNLSLIHI